MYRFLQIIGYRSNLYYSGGAVGENRKDILTPYLKEIGLNIVKDPTSWKFTFPTEEDYHKMCFHFGYFDE